MGTGHVQKAARPGLGANSGPELELDEVKPKMPKLCKISLPFSDLVLTASLRRTPAVTRPGSCKCSGGCNMQGHRYRANTGKRPICSSTSFVGGSGLCLGCKCSVLSCDRVRRRSDLCWRHKEIMKKLPWRFHAMRAARHILLHMMPSNIIVFVVEVFDQLKMKGLCSILFAALLKEPTVVRAFVDSLSGFESGGPVSAGDIFKAIVETIQRVDGPSNVDEIMQTTTSCATSKLRDGVRAICERSVSLVRRQRKLVVCAGPPSKSFWGSTQIQAGYRSM